MNYRINAFDRLMSSTDGKIWTTLPPKQEARVLERMAWQARKSLTQLVGLVAPITGFTVAFA